MLGSIRSPGEDDKSSGGIQVVGESVNDSLPVVESEKSFGICCTRVGWWG
ncbi:hypothetical protein HanRHA438_Chr13g0581051 [Helianthus annuus]|nr:hypothetical protein HanRHA438_Chr13g0581051 [Helianthus annuus]